MASNTLKIFGADGLTRRETYYNVEDFKVLDSGSFTFKIGPLTNRANAPASSPVKPGSANVTSESLVLGKIYICNGTFEYSSEPN